MNELIHNQDTLKMFQSWPTEMKCQYIYTKTEHEGWPVERSCALFNISSVWYRNRVMRNRELWEAECQANIEDNRQYNEFFKRASQVTGIDFSVDENQNRMCSIVFSVEEYHLQQKEEIFEYDNISNDFLVEAALLFNGESTKKDFLAVANVLANKPVKTNSNKYTHLIQIPQTQEAQVT